jgi:NodT family efflux transporter outer membrane factor (OMF) lipoprotein
LRISIIVGSMVLSGCMVGPNYKQPDVQLPADYVHTEAPASRPATQPTSTQPARQAAAVVPRVQPVDQWWAPLNDPMLDSLVSQAINQNFDLQVAAARVLQTRELRRVAAADLLPQLGSSGGYNYSGASRNSAKPTSGIGLKKQVASDAIGTLGSLAAGGGTAGTGTSNPLVTGLINGVTSKLQKELTESTRDRQSNMFQAGFDASWEIDFFGGIRRSVEAAQADIETSEQEFYSVALTLVSEVARNYIEARGYQKRIAVLNQNIDSQRSTLELTKVRFQAGLTSELDVAQAAAQLAGTQSTVPLLEILHKQAVHRLGVLLGRAPGELLEQMAAAAPIPAIPPEAPIGLPSELLRRRPDIRAAERTVAGQTARIGVAVADLYPRFSITGGFGTQTYDMQHFLDRNSMFWSIGPSFSWPIFQGGRLRANIKVQEAIQMQVLAQYRITILSALEDVENSLVSYRQDQIRYQSLTDAVDASRRAVDLSTERYRKGLADFLSVLESQRSLYVAEDEMISSETDVVADYIALNKSLGGGWQIADNKIDDVAAEAAALTK